MREFGKTEKKKDKPLYIRIWNYIFSFMIREETYRGYNERAKRRERKTLFDDRRISKN